MKSICMLVQGVYDFDPRVRRKAEALVAAGYAVDVLALRPERGRKSYTLDGVNVYTLSLGKKRGTLLRYFAEYATFFLWALVRVPQLMRRRRYAVIDVNTLPDFLIFAPVLARWMGAKLLLDMHEITPEFYQSKFGIAESSWTIRVLKYLERVSFEFADHVITINEPIRKLLVQRGLPSAKVTVVMNAVDESRFASTSTATAAAGDASDRFVMMYHGTLTRIYGLDIAIEAFGLAHQQMPGAEMWILGSGPEQGPLANLAGRRGLASKVKMIGQVSSSEIPGWLNQCDLGVLPLRRDVFLDFAFPNKLPEFIVMGKVVAISRLKAIEHYFSDDALAYFEPNSPSELAKQMVRVYRDRSLRVRLAATARTEYAPIRWDLMKERYLSLVAALVNPVTRTAASEAGTTLTARAAVLPATVDPVVNTSSARETAKATALKLLAYCRANDWAGHDPYDALNSGIFTALPGLNSRIPRLIATQTLKRSPVDLRRLMRIPSTQNPKAMALFLSASLKLRGVAPAQVDGLPQLMIERLVALRSQGTPHWCWGYSFPWQTRTLVVPRGAPNLVCTTFAAGALLDAYEQQRGESRCLTMAVSAAEYMVNELYRTDGGRVAGFSYPMPSMGAQIHNANFLAAALLCRVYTLTGDAKFLGPALKVARYSAGRQRDDGAWAYGESETQRWVDNFHTGYNLCALQDMGRRLGTDEFEPHVKRGFEFYRTHFFREDGAPRYFHDRTYPIDVHCVAQSIITLLAFRDLHPNAVPLADSVLQWAVNHLWDERGFFYYRVLRFGTVRTSYMRWSQAWMLMALATFLNESPAVLTGRQSFNSAATA